MHPSRSPISSRLRLALLALFVSGCAGTAAPNITHWHVIWTGGQSNSIGSNSQTTGNYPTWATTPRLQSYCHVGTRGCTGGSFTPSAVPLPGESNVGFSQTFGNLLLNTLPAQHGVVLVNTGVGGTGFIDGNWVPPNGPLVVRSVAAVSALFAALPAALGGVPLLHAMLWHQGELDAGDNRVNFHADYCTHLLNDTTALAAYMRATLPGAGKGTPFVNGGLLPYWEDTVVNGTGGVPAAIYSLNTSLPCTATADSRVFPDLNPDGTPNGDPVKRSGASGDVIHFTATQAVVMGYQYFSAYARAVLLPQVVVSPRTEACPGWAGGGGPVAQCG